MLNYDEMIERVEQLDFIEDRKTADAACKAVWGIMSSVVDEPLAEEVASELPEPLTRQKLRSHQVRRLTLDSERFIQEIRTQFNLETSQSRELVETIIHLGEQNLDRDSLARLKQAMPEDLAVLL